jgi:hypothetical protein
VLGGTSGEGVQWTVDILDGGGGPMANKNKSPASESDGDVFVGTIPSLGHSWGESSHLVPELNYLKKISRKSSEI